MLEREATSGKRPSDTGDPDVKTPPAKKKGRTSQKRKDEPVNQILKLIQERHEEKEEQKEERNMITKVLGKALDSHQHLMLSYAEQLNKMDDRQANKIKFQIAQLFYEAACSEVERPSFVQSQSYVMNNQSVTGSNNPCEVQYTYQQL